MLSKEILEQAEEFTIWPIDKLWNVLELMRNDEDYNISQSVYDNIKYGFKLKFPIYYLIEEWYDIYPTSKRVRVLGHAKFELNAFMEEKDQREQAIRQLLYDNVTSDEIQEPRC